jgi:hypothetical protein
MAKPLAKPFANYFVPNMSCSYGLEILSTSHIQVFFCSVVITSYSYLLYFFMYKNLILLLLFFCFFFGEV